MNPKPTPRRPARPEEICSCGRRAVKVLLLDDLGPTPYCGEFEDNAHKPVDCPPWCTAEHSLPFDQVHYGQDHSIELDAHPYVQRVASGEWEHHRSRIAVGITKDPGAKPAYISMVGYDDQTAGHLTAYEADQLADILHELAATLRREEAAR